MFQTEGREIGMIPGSVSEAGLQRRGRALERCPAGNLETHLSSPSASSKQALNRLWISRGGREPANVIKGERNHVWRQEKQKQRRETPGGCSYCISENMSPFALLKATPGLGEVGGGWRR